ncbi:MAG TPA: tripartite tricarboxylate transporter TctB family protein [Burkholderiaceae bacterium]|jgi:putative tricarboxylic transport membrane protein
MKLNDAVFGAVFLALSLLVLWTIQGYPRIPGQNVGPSAFPGAIAIGLAVCSLLLIRNGWSERASSPWFHRGQWTRQPQQVIAFGVTAGALVLYVVASERIGFLIVATVMLTAMMLALRVRLVPALAVALAASLLIHVAFYKGLRVPLPWGVLPVLY